MGRYLLTALLLLARGVAGAQIPEITAPNAILVELGGRGGFYTISYERQFSPHHAVAGGISVLSFSGLPLILGLPVGYSFSPFTSDSRFFIDAGLTPFLGFDHLGAPGVVVFPSLGVGFQYRPFTGAQVFRIQLLLGYVPDMEFYSGPFLPWGGIATGRSF